MEHRIDQLKGSNVLSNVRQSLGAEDEDDTCKDDIINTMSSDEIFEAWCNYEGLIHYADELKTVVEAIWQTKLEEPK